MPTSLLPLLFVSAQGPNVVPVAPDVRFLKSAPDFKTALAEKQRLDPTTGNGFAIVIYRLFYNSKRDEFFSSRQFNLDPKSGGNELYAKEPRERAAVAYELFSAPKTLLSAGPVQPEVELSKQVQAIFEHSSSHRPGGVSP